MNRKILTILLASATLAISTTSQAHNDHGWHGYGQGYGVQSHPVHPVHRHDSHGSGYRLHGYPYRYGVRVYPAPRAWVGHRHHHGCGHHGYYPRPYGLGFGFSVDGVSFTIHGGY